MRVALITTTVNVPTVLELYRQHGRDIAFFVAGDLKEPEGIAAFCESIRATFLSAPSQVTLGYKCSELIGWNSIQRRNIALLEAVKWGAEIIVSIDDDNIPLDPHPSITHAGYFSHFRSAFGLAYHEGQFNGIKVSSPTGWFDVGTLLDPVAPHRGFPYQHRNDAWKVGHVVGAKVGVAAGITLGNPDICASTRIERAPQVHRVSELLHSGVVVDPKTWTVFNSQTTAFVRELAPAFFMWPGVGRMDDIYASLVMQKVMQQKGLHVHFGKPFVFQERNEHDLIKDLRQEIDGMENVRKLAGILDNMPAFAVDETPERQIWKHLRNVDWVPKTTIDCALAFLDDCESVL